MRVGIVIPTLNEASNLPGLAEDLAALGIDKEIVVADGGSSDETVAIARSLGLCVVDTESGRGAQMNAGARQLAVDWLCFLHADVRLGKPALADLERTIADPDAVAAVWRLEIDAPGYWFRVIEFGAALRGRFLGLAYGDQGLLIRSTLFRSIGGFRETPIMEDVAMVREIRRTGTLRTLPSAIKTSPRRWLREGPVKTWIRNAALVSAYRAGVSPERLARWYRPSVR